LKKLKAECEEDNKTASYPINCDQMFSAGNKKKRTSKKK
jgi:hypothetical protein